MLALAQRNIKLYFRNHTGVVMSLIGALISFLFIFASFKRIYYFQIFPSCDATAQTEPSISGRE